MSNIHKTHYTFGNDESRMISSYWQDFGPPRLSCYRSNTLRPPSPAQVFPLPEHANEKGKWLTSNKRDFLNFHNGDINRKLYYQTMGEFNEIKRFQTHGNVWNETAKLPPLYYSRSSLDYREPNKMSTSCRTPLVLSRIKAKTKDSSVYRKPTLATEAMHAFQWPTHQRKMRMSPFRRMPDSNVKQ